MIVNSHPYNPSQRSQQQRCIGINQQNSLYGLKLATDDALQMNIQQQARPNHMFDLATLQQEQPQQQELLQATNSNTNNHNGNIFDSAYYDASNSTQLAAGTFVQSDQLNANQTAQASQPAKMMMNNSASNKQMQTADMSLYSPSSSTSLLYHHYDQINVPNEHSLASHTNSNSSSSTSNNNTTNNEGNGDFKRSSNTTTTILNPANLFGQSNMGNPQQQSTNHMTNSKTTILQQELYGAGPQYHLHQPSFNNTLHHHHHHQQQHHHHPSLHQAQSQTNTAYGLDNHQFMLDTILRQQHMAAASNTSRFSQHGGASYHNRPLSSSGASSMSGGQTMALTYGRQPRQANSQLPPLPPINSSKSQNTLASVLQSNQTLNHLGLSLNGHLTPSMMDTRGPKKLSNQQQQQQHHHHSFPPVSPSLGVGGTPSGNAASRKWQRAQQRVQSFAYQYGSLLRFAMLLILLAFTIMSVIKFTSLNNPTTTSALPAATIPVDQNQLLQNYPQHPVSSHGGSNSLAQSNMNPLVYPSQPKLVDSAARPDVDFNKWAVTEQYSASESSTVSPDVLSSKLLIGEFVILSQNYSNSEAHRSVLAENIVKLMDQVFLSTDVRRVYSRMQVVEIRPHMPTGIIVKCNIILSESIIYAAQQFGIALYDSLVKSNEKLANQPGFIIDKNSIRFNTIPDKDLPMVPPQLLPNSLAPASPSDVTRQQLDNLKPHLTNADQPQDQNAVVWSEWSQWSSCVDKNGMCDPTRLHSRLRKCVSQHTGEKVEASECRQRFNMQDLELEVTDCSSACVNSAMSSQQQQQQGILSDAPLVITPNTAPSMMMGAEPTPAFLLPAPLNRGTIKQQQQQQQSSQPSAMRIGAFDPTSPSSNPGSVDAYNAAAPAGTDPTTTGVGGGGGGSNRQQNLPASMLITSTQSSSTSISTPDNGSGSVISATQSSAMPTLDQQQQQMSCSNCTSDEICLLLVTQKVPFCAKIKDRLDESGCGGWCKAKDEVCQPAGQNAFKCTHNSECLAHEWRCHDSQCIPASKRCDGHENCFDSSDERYCPTR